MALCIYAGSYRLRVLILIILMLLSACSDGGRKSSQDSMVSNSDLTGTWLSDSSDSLGRWFHISGESENLVVTHCYAKLSENYTRENNLIIEESGRGYWYIKDENNLYKGGGEVTARKIDSEGYYSFGNLTVTIGNSEYSILNTSINTSEFCWQQLSDDGLYFNIYAEDHANFKMEVRLYSPEFIGTYAVELGEAYVRVTWNDSSNDVHIEWFESGGLECSVTPDDSVLCNIDGELILSGPIEGQFVIDKQYITNPN